MKKEFFMTDKDLKILKNSIEYVKSLDLFNKNEKKGKNKKFKKAA